MSDDESLREYLRRMETAIGAVTDHASPEHKDRLHAETAFLQSYSSSADAGSGHRHLSSRHRAIQALLSAVIGSLRLSDQNRLIAAIRDDISQSDRLLDDLVSAGVVHRRMARARSYNNPTLCRPIFLISSWRSGSTLLASLLGSHKNLAALPETNLLDPFLTATADATRNFKPLLYRQRPPILDACNHTLQLGITDECFYEHFSTFIDAAISPYVRERGGQRWIYKEISNPDSLALIDLLFGYRACFIWLVRHGLDVINSEIERYERLSVQCPDFSDYAREWTLRNELFADFYDRTPDRCTKVRYEELVLSPLCETRRLIEFLGEPWDEDIFARMQSVTGALRGDSKYPRSHGVIDSDRIGRWEQWPQVFIQQLGQIVNPMLIRAGYEAIG